VAEPVDDRGPGAWQARRDEGAYTCFFNSGATQPAELRQSRRRKTVRLAGS